MHSARTTQPYGYKITSFIQTHLIQSHYDFRPIIRIMKRSGKIILGKMQYNLPKPINKPDAYMTFIT